MTFCVIDRQYQAVSPASNEEVSVNVEMKNLTLTRPLAALDVETTGVDPRTDRVVELGVVKVHPIGAVVSFARR